MIELTATHLQHLPPDIVEDLEGRGRFEDIYADSTVRMVRGVCCLASCGTRTPPTAHGHLDGARGRAPSKRWPT
ncbi:MAG: hypothetical protein JRD89_09095 [Deltaproteobacteria bacterium]|nr:hypothetical protein [Deltaproteobacteria bacterium]